MGDFLIRKLSQNILDAIDAWKTAQEKRIPGAHISITSAIKVLLEFAINNSDCEEAKRFLKKELLLNDRQRIKTNYRR